MKAFNLYLLWPAGIIFSLVISACAGTNGGSDQAIPVANITSPQSGNTLTQGQEILITFNTADVKGVAQVELVIDGQPALVETVSPPVNAYTASFRWRASTPGSHVIELRAFNVDSTPSQPSQIFVTVIASEDAVQATPLAQADTPTPVVPTNTPSPLPPTPTVPLLTPTPTEMVSVVETEATVTMLVGLNVRLGPGTTYPVIGRLPEGATARITGRDPFSAWWQIEYSSSQGDRGWVSGGSQFSTATNIGNVPIVEAPPLAASPTPPPTSTPASLKPTIYSFTANRYTIAKGESVTLNWDLANAQAAYLRYSDIEEGVVAPGSKIVAPDRDTKYTLIARNNAGDTVAELTIKVTEAAATPVPIFRDGKVRIAHNQNVDFDQGIVQAGAGADFLWDGQKRQFFPQSGAAGALLGKSYTAIILDDCLKVAYNQPIAGVDGSSLITGCYITSEERYGKFFVSEWDLTGNLTIEWATWNYQP